MSDIRRPISLALAAILAAGLCAHDLVAEETESPEDAAALNETVRAEMERLTRMQEELEAIESAPLPAPVSAGEETPAPAAPKSAPKRTAADIPAKPAPGAEEQYANMLFALGEYERAMPFYQRIAEKSGSPDAVGWALLQEGNCARHNGNHVAALASYAKALAKAQDTPWAAEASWWTAQVKWRLLWNEESVRKLEIPKMPEHSDRTQPDPEKTDSLAAK